jgi:type IV pilus assembly protein PilB
LTRAAVDPVLCSAGEIRRAIDQAYTGQGAAIISSADLEEVAGEGDEGSLNSAIELLLKEEGQEEAPVVRVINLMVLEAIQRRASDIHVEPAEGSLRVRYRVDGRLLEIHRLPKAVQNTVLTRLKIMSGMDITESRLPQDGRFKVRIEEREVDFRVSILPILHGGKVVLRLLDKRNLANGLEQLGFVEADVRRFQTAVKRAYGMLLITGPTGSGKSTTLYALLTQLNTPERNLVTLEDPVEYQIEGITQMQARPEIGLTFASGLRSALRQNPDVMMVGEIRDFETADIAMKSALTGNLVLSTLHTNDAPSAMTRLIDMGVEPFLVASSVSVVEAQRLVRRLCQKCREPIQPSAEVLARCLAGAAAPKAATFFQSKGCRQCSDTGYRGRMCVAEVFEVDDRVRELIVARAPSWEIKDYAIKAQGMRTLRQDALGKAAAGLTTLEEVLAVTAAE